MLSKNGSKNCPKFQHLAEFLPNKNSSWSAPRYSHDGLTATIGISPRSKVSRSRPSIAPRSKVSSLEQQLSPCIRSITPRADISPGSKVSRQISLRSSNAAWVTCAPGRGQMADGESRCDDDDHENNVHHFLCFSLSWCQYVMTRMTLTSSDLFFSSDQEQMADFDHWVAFLPTLY